MNTTTNNNQVTWDGKITWSLFYAMFNSTHELPEEEPALTNDSRFFEQKEPVYCYPQNKHHVTYR